VDKLKKIESKKMRTPINFIIVGVIVAVLFWFLEGLMHGLFFRQPFFWNEVIPQAHELWMRLLVIMLIMLFGIFAQYIFHRYCRLSHSLELSEQRYKMLFKKAPVAITVVDTEGTVVDCNKSTELLTGFSREELIGNPFQKLLTLEPEDLPMLQEKFELLARGRDVAAYELKIKRKDGELRWINVVNSLIIADGAVHGFQVIATDITEMKHNS
jgi:PAS domain S-box-containing protein